MKLREISVDMTEMPLETYDDLLFAVSALHTAAQLVKQEYGPNAIPVWRMDET